MSCEMKVHLHLLRLKPSCCRCEVEARCRLIEASIDSIDTDAGISIRSILERLLGS